MVYKWAKDYVKYDGHNIEPIHIFFSDSGGIGKSHLGKVIYNAISKTLLYHCKDQEKLGLGPIGISAVSTFGITIHSGLEIKLGPKLLRLNDKSKVALRNRLPEVKFLITDELSAISSDLWPEVDSWLGEIR